MQMKNLKERSLRAASIKLVAQGANFILRIGTLMVLARLLTPADFGLVGMVTAVTGIFSIFKDAGLSMVTIQRDSISDEEVSTLFWLNIAAGMLLGLVSLALAPLLVRFYGEPMLFWITAALATGFVFNGAGVQHAALLQREMQFSLISSVEIVAQLASSVVGIGLALSHYEYWALVAMAVANPSVTTVGVWMVKSWRPRKPRQALALMPMLRFGGIATVHGIVAYLAYNLDKLLLGRFGGAEVLGIYGRAAQLIAIPSENLNAATGGVLFSALSRLQHDPGQFKNYFLKSYMLILSLTLASTLICAVLAKDLVLLVLGAKWNEVIIPFQLLSPAVAVLAVMSPTYWLMIALGRPGRSLAMTCSIAPFLVAAYAVGLPYGSSGVAFGYSIVMVLWLVPYLVWCVRGTVISLGDLLPAICKPLLSSMVAALLTSMMQSLYPPNMVLLSRLAFGVGIFLVTYIWMLGYVMDQKQFYIETFRGLRAWPASLNVAK